MTDLDRDNYPREPVLGPTTTRRQHYVPQVYLKSFAQPDGSLRATDFEAAGRTFRTGTPSVTVESGFYDVELEGQRVSSEDWLSDVEGAVSPVLRRLIDDPGALLALSGSDEETMARFLASFRFRTPAFRRQAQATRDQLVGHLKDMTRFHMERTLPRDEAARLWAIWDAHPDEWWLTSAGAGAESLSGLTAWMLSGVQGFANLVYSMGWRIGRVPARRQLYTTDNPLSGRLKPIRPWWETGAFVSFRYFVPLSPDVLLQLEPWLPSGPPPLGQPGRRDHMDFNVWEAEFAAKVVSASATRYAYGDARVVPPTEARDWLDDYEAMTVAWAVLVLGHNPEQPELGGGRRQDRGETNARALLRHPRLMRLAAALIRPREARIASELRALVTDAIGIGKHDSSLRH